jgi:hypothetical protein
MRSNANLARPIGTPQIEITAKATSDAQLVSEVAEGTRQGGPASPYGRLRGVRIGGGFLCSDRAGYPNEVCLNLGGGLRASFFH